MLPAHGVDRSLLGACDHKIGERPALQFGRAQEEVLLLTADPGVTSSIRVSGLWGQRAG